MDTFTEYYVERFEDFLNIVKNECKDDSQEFNRENRIYNIESGTESECPDIAFRAQQLQGESYVSMGYVNEAALDKDGRLFPELDRSRGDDVEYYLATHKERSDVQASLRIMRIPDGGTLCDLPSYKYCKNGEMLDEWARDALRKQVLEYGTDSVIEIAALSKSDAASHFASLELIREIIQESVKNGKNEKWLITLTDRAYKPMHDFFGPLAIRKIGEPVAIDEGDDRTSDTLRLIPVMISPLSVFDDIASVINHTNEAIGDLDNKPELRKAKNNRRRMVRALKFMIDGLEKDEVNSNVWALTAEVDDSRKSQQYTSELASKIGRIAMAMDLSWSKPDRYVLGIDKDIDDKISRMIESGDIAHVIDPANEIIAELVDMKYVGCSNNELKEQFRKELLEKGISYGQWVYFPWNRTLIRYPDELEHKELRTYRNRELINSEEQRRLGKATIAVFGLSVGGNIVDRLVQSGVGNRYVLADFDAVSPTNLNRLNANMTHVGLPKTVLAGRKMSEVDPYIEQIHLDDGYTGRTDDIIRDICPDVIIEEVDNVQVKAQIRRLAADAKIPVIMAGDVGERAVISVERYDRGEKPFNGRVSKADFEELLGNTPPKRVVEGTLIKLNGFRNLSPRLLESSMDIGKSLSGFPQLGSTAVMGAALTDLAVREILLGRRMKSGVYVHNARKALNTQSTNTLQENFKIARRTVQYLKRHEE